MPKVKCLRNVANTLAGSTIVTTEDDTICKILSKMSRNLRKIPDDSTLLHNVSDVVFVVNVTQNEDQSYSSDKTLEEINAASTAGKFIVCKLGAYYLYPSQVSADLCYFYSDIMATATVCQRSSVAITSAYVGVAMINYVLTPPEVETPAA